MINISTVMKALEDQYAANAEVSNLFKRPVLRGEPVNEDPGQTPWAGIYRGKMIIDPRTLGSAARHWRTNQAIRVLVQAASMRTASDCEEILDEALQVIMDATFADKTFGNTIDMLKGAEIEYMYDMMEQESLYFQTAIITLEVEGSTQ